MSMSAPCSNYQKQNALLMNRTRCENALMIQNKLAGVPIFTATSPLISGNTGKNDMPIHKLFTAYLRAFESFSLKQFMVAVT